MKKEEIKIYFDQKNYITISFQDLIRIPLAYSYVSITFKGEGCGNLLIAHDIPLLSGLKSFDNSFEKLMRQKLELTFDTQKDIGYLWNEVMHNVQAGSATWLGISYMLFSTSHGPTTWIYTKHNKIYFEITPSYPWHFRMNKRPRKAISYEVFMRNYRSLAQVTLSHEQAHNFLAEVKNWLNRVRKNTWPNEHFCDEHEGEGCPLISPHKNK